MQKLQLTVKTEQCGRSICIVLLFSFRPVDWNDYFFIFFSIFFIKVIIFVFQLEKKGKKYAIFWIGRFLKFFN